MTKKILLTSLGIGALLLAPGLQAQTTITANLDESMRVQKGAESGTLYEARFQGGTGGGFQGLKSMRSMVEKMSGLTPDPEDVPIGWAQNNATVHGFSSIFTPSNATLINTATSISFDFSVASVQGNGADGVIQVYLTHIGPVVGGNTGPNGGSWGGYANYNGDENGYNAGPGTLIGTIADPSAVQSYSFDVTNMIQTTYGGMASGDEIAFLMIMEDDVVTAGTLGDAITNSVLDQHNRTNIELGTALDQTAGPRLVVVPEPSTYAAILGALALGFIMVRRRLRK